MKLLPARPRPQWILFIALLIGAFLATLDATVVNLALASIQTDLKADLLTGSWVVTIYTLVPAALMVAAGRLADQYGYKRVFLIALCLFGLGSALCASSTSIAWLIAFRALQALGASCLSTTSFVLITTIFSDKARSMAIGLWGATGGLAATVGPVLGGLLTQTIGWRWIFFANLPLGLISFGIVAARLADMPVGERKRSDLLGLLTLSCALVCLTLAILQGNRWGWTSGIIVSLFVGALTSALLFVLVERTQQEPLVDLRIFHTLNFTTSTISIFLLGGAFQGALLLLPLYFLTMEHYPPLEVAYAISPLSLLAFLVSIGATRFSPRSARLKGFLGLILLAVGFGLLAHLPAQTSYLNVVWRGGIIGAGIGLCFSSFAVSALADLSPAHLGVGSGLFNTSRLLGFTVGVALLISTFTGSMQHGIMTARADSVVLIQQDRRLPSSMRETLAARLTTTPSLPSRAEIMGLADDTPQDTPLLAELSILSDRLNQHVQGEAMQAFTWTWLLASLFPGLGIGIVLLFFLWERLHEKQQRANAWASAYFFSRRGVMTLKTSQQHLKACHQADERYPPTQTSPYHLPLKSIVFPSALSQ